MKLLLDTHIWLWTVAQPAKISRRVRAALGRSETEIWLSPISIWEILVLAERGRIKPHPEPRKWIAEALSRGPVREAALTFEVAIRSREIMPAHEDPADRFLAATAVVYDFTLVTADEALIQSKACAVMANR